MAGVVKLGSLFSGCGGLDLAVEEVFGAETVWQCESDPAASRVLAAHWPGVPNLGDITKVDWSAVEPVDILCGGFPCQDISSAGKQAGIGAGTRSGLWSEFRRAIDELRPRLAVVENVRNLLSVAANRGDGDESADCDVESGEDDLGDVNPDAVLRGLGAVLGDLSDMRYDARWTTVSAASVGAPHRRERVFLLAYPEGRGRTNGAKRGGETRFDVRAVAGAGDRDSERSAAARVSELGGVAAKLAVAAHPQSVRRGVLHTTDIGTAHREVDTLTDHRDAAPHSPRDGRHEGRPEPARQQRGFDAPLSGVGPVNPAAAMGRAIAEAEDRDVRRLLGLPVPETNKRDLRQIYREAQELLPTPRTSDTNGAGRHGDGGLDLRTVVSELLPTPTTSDCSGGGVNPDEELGRYYTDTSARRVGDKLRDAVKFDGGSQWGKYAPAIARWEQVLGRPAPSPTEPNRNGNPRLNPQFSEWMMGWPAGWVTDIDISRNDKLRCIGNGVIPQQAIAALTWLLSIEVAA